VVVGASVLAAALAGSVAVVGAVGPDAADMLRMNNEHVLRENGRLPAFGPGELLLLNNRHVLTENRHLRGFGLPDLLRLNHEHVLQEYGSTAR
jgi:hypothetical protein